MERVTQCASGFVRALTRTKTLDVQHLQDTQLRRCLSVFDLTSLGVGSTLGAGVYVLTGQVARNQTGPAIVLSFLVAAVASLLAGICYAEFAARVPRAGSAYVYSYVSIGELWAFVIGWNMILENMIGAASVARAWSQYLDSLFNDTIRISIETHVGQMEVPGLATYPDFMALAVLILVTLLVSLGVKMSSVLSSVFTVLNLLVIICIVAVGAFYADGRNWTDSPGFFPFGFRGVLSGAATCFYAFVGFDTIATSGEEARRPTHSIPTAIVITLVICFVAYFGVSAILTLIVPWYSLSAEAALPKAFAQRGVYGAEYVIAVGGLCGLTASMLGSIFPLPRTVYAMAQDGLLFRFLGHVSVYTDTPILATWICGIMGGILALLLDLNSLVQMMSIGTLMAYTLVAISVLVLHYQSEQVGLTVLDMHQDLDLTHENGDLPVGNISRLEQQSSLSEDTGLLRVGDKVKVVRYVPSKETTVFKRISSHRRDDDDDDDDDDVDNDVIEPSSSGAVASNSTTAAPTAAATTSSSGNGLAASGNNQTLTKDSLSAAGKSKREVLEATKTKRDKEIMQRMAQLMTDASPTPPGSTYQRIDSNYSLSSVAQLFNLGDDVTAEPTAQTRRVAILAMVTMFALWASVCVLTVYGEEYVQLPAWWAVFILTGFSLLVVVLFIVLCRQPRNKAKLNFKTPFVPFIPVASVMINVYLMITLSAATWLRFVV